MQAGKRIEFEYLIPIILVGFLFIIGSLQIFSRFVLSYPLTWGEEAMRLSFIFLVFFGAVAVTKNKDHLVVDLVNILLKPKMSQRSWIIYERVVLLLQTFFFALCAYGSFQMAAVRWDIVSQTMPFWKIGYMYTLTGAAFSGCSIVSLYLIFRKDVKE